MIIIEALRIRVHIAVDGNLPSFLFFQPDDFSWIFAMLDYETVHRCFCENFEEFQEIGEI